jgi:hypothetical protein
VNTSPSACTIGAMLLRRVALVASTAALLLPSLPALAQPVELAPIAAPAEEPLHDLMVGGIAVSIGGFLVGCAGSVITAVATTHALEGIPWLAFVPVGGGYAWAFSELETPYLGVILGTITSTIQVVGLALLIGGAVARQPVVVRAGPGQVGLTITARW